ncbi:vitamin K epoxide reductase family protein [Candidatus Uhrbacteria bacterium]|nr:vitamin K epoxide reductase family protein [Candidatus Uhrbacteria bacterium]
MSARIIPWILAASLLGLAISSYSFLHNRGFTSGSFCTINETVNCDVVNKGAYSTVVGIPVALVGVLGYGFLVLASILKVRAPHDRQLTRVLLIASVLGLAFSLYLTSLEAFVLHAWCLLCVSSQIMIILIVILTSYLTYHESYDHRISQS